MWELTAEAATILLVLVVYSARIAYIRLLTIYRRSQAVASAESLIVLLSVELARLSAEVERLRSRLEACESES